MNLGFSHKNRKLVDTIDFNDISSFREMNPLHSNIYNLHQYSSKKTEGSICWLCEKQI